MEPLLSFISSPRGMTPGPFEGLVALAAIWGFVVTVFWMIVGWRAMRAHERLADTTEHMARKDTRA